MHKGGPSQLESWMQRTKTAWSMVQDTFESCPIMLGKIYTNICVSILCSQITKLFLWNKRTFIANVPPVWETSLRASNKVSNYNNNWTKVVNKDLSFECFLVWSRERFSMCAHEVRLFLKNCLYGESTLARVLCYSVKAPSTIMDTKPPALWFTRFRLSE